MFDYINNGKYIFWLCLLCNVIFDIGTRCVAVSVGVRVPLRSLDSTGFLVSRRLLRHPKAHWLHSVPILTEEDVRCSYTTQLESCLEQLKSDCPANGSKYYILAIETSCDDCCAAVVSSNGDVVSEERASNPDSLIKFGGIKPDESYRFHLDNIDRIMNEVVSKAKLKFEDIGYIVVTRGPGMRICLNAGYDAAERISKTYGIPLIGENHLAGHCLSPFIKGHQLRMTHDRGSVASEELKYPYLSLLLSGGHSQIYVVESPYQYHMLVDTMDHYAGNVLYKCAKELGLPIDTGGGPSIEEAARKRQGRPMFRMTEPCKGMSFTSFCFSGIQTQLRNMVSKIRQDLGEDALSEDPKLVNHLAYTCQEVTFNQVIRQLDKALDICETLFGISQIVVVGGVSCNQRLRKKIADLLHRRFKETHKRKRKLIDRLYGYVKKTGPIRHFERKDANENMLIRNLVDRMRGVDTLTDFLKLLWGQELYPDLLQRREGIHLSVQQKNAFYSALLQAYLSLLSESQTVNLHDRLQNGIRVGQGLPLPTSAILTELSQFEQVGKSRLISRHLCSRGDTPAEWHLFTTSPMYCTDNAVMIGYSLLEKHRHGINGLKHGSFDEKVTDKWNLSFRRHWELLADIAHLHALTED